MGGLGSKSYLGFRKVHFVTLTNTFREPKASTARNISFNFGNRSIISLGESNTFHCAK